MIAQRRRVLRVAIGGWDNELLCRPSPLSSLMCHVTGAFEIQYNAILNRGLWLYFVATYRYTYRYMARRKEKTQKNWYTGISMRVRGLLIAYRYTITAVDVHTYILKTLLADNSIIWHPMQQLETR